MILGDSFAIKILASDASHIDTCFTFGVTSCQEAQLDEFPETHQMQLCGSDTICNGICNSMTLRDPIFKQPDSIICFRRTASSLIEISVDGTVHQVLNDHSENNILSFVPSLVPFFILNGAVSAIMYWPDDSSSIIDTISRIETVDLSDEASSVRSSSSDSSPNSESTCGFNVVVNTDLPDPPILKACSSGTPNVAVGSKVSIGVGTHEDCESGLIPWDPACVICFNQQRTFVSLPCFHFAYCEEDAKKIIDKPCAICRIPVKDIHVAYYC